VMVSCRNIVWAYFRASPKHPDHHVLCVSHTLDLAEKHAKRARNLILEHSAALGIEIAGDSGAAGSWNLKSSEGSCFAIGAGGAAVGRRAIFPPGRSLLSMSLRNQSYWSRLRFGG
jgi:hypothetical protein